MHEPSGDPPSRGPIEPPPTHWVFPDPTGAQGDLIAVGADLSPGTVLAAYRAGLFPMPVSEAEAGVMAWWSPDPRGILPLDGLKVSRSLRRSQARFEVTVNTAFEEVISACASATRPGGWISLAMREAYIRLHHLGWSHSVEAWSREDGTLAGGLYGVAIGALFAGESMFHRVTDASKVALTGLVDLLVAGGAELLDVQWRTPHLASLGAVDVPREEYLRLLARALGRPLPPAFTGVPELGQEPDGRGRFGAF
jgi:leucyl/phenylalanyl-tRNA--protein transferase